jgi:hypothetical protein
MAGRQGQVAARAAKPRRATPIDAAQRLVRRNAAARRSSRRVNIPVPRDVDRWRREGPLRAVNGIGAGPALSPKKTPLSALANARTDRVERRTGEGSDLHHPAAGNCPNIHITY